MRLVAAAALAVVFGASAFAAEARSNTEMVPWRLVSPSCTSEYADYLSDMLPANAAFEKGPESSYSYCLRTIATYEHLYYGSGGKLKHEYLKAISHGTGFAYKTVGGVTYLATNEHVAEYPDVTDDAHPVDGIPNGSKKVREVVKIVANENDDYAPGQITLTKVLADPALDVAVFKTHHPLKVMPYRFGNSKALRVGNVVLVRGYPLGVFPASNTGKVINTHQQDDDGQWHHVDFVIDALLNQGNSGSPVFAVSCRTGELELVGIYHAHYTSANGLGLVIGIDQLRDILENLKLPTEDQVAEKRTAAEDRQVGLAALASHSPQFFPFADQIVRVEREPGGVVRFTLFRDFPLTNVVKLSITDRDGQMYLAMPSRVSGAVSFGALDPQMREPLEHLHRMFWHTFRRVLDYRRLDAQGASGSDAAQMVSDAQSNLQSHHKEQSDLLSTVSYEADDAAWPVIVDATERIERDLPLFDRDSPDGGVRNAAIPPALAQQGSPAGRR